MMHKRERPFSLRPIGCILFLLIAVSACEKPEERMLGKDAIPAEQRMNSKVQDTFSIHTRSVTMPDVPAIKSDPGLVGKLRDDRTGTTRGILHSQLLLQGTNIDMGDPSDLVLDSAVLSLRYDGYYGDTNTVQEFRVHQVIENMNGIDPGHRDSLDRSSNPIGNLQKAPAVQENVTVDGGNKAPHLRIRLKDSFGENILDRSGESELKNNSNFTNFIHGISISSYTSSLQNGEGAMLRFQIPHELSKVTLYYRNTSLGDTGTLNLELGASFFNTIVNNPNGSDMATQLDSAFSEDRVRTYVQGPGEVATQMRFPTVSSLNDSTKVSINKAVLELPIETTNNADLPPAGGFFVMYKDAAGDLSLTKDRIQEGGQFIGGAYEEKENRYRFRLTRHFQAILNGEVTSNSLYISTSIPFLSEGEATTVARSVLKGPGASESPRLVVTYTEY